MFVELLELLRCPNPHEESPLIASAERTEHRHLVQGTLGCPVCRSEFRVMDGVVVFGAGPVMPPDPPDPDLAMRLAAFLELNEPRRFAILCGRYASQADQIARITPTPLVLVNPPGDVAGEPAAILRVGAVLPLAAGTAHAAAMDERIAGALAQSVVRVVRAGGRLVGPVTLPVPDGVREIVRDEQMWVAEKNAAPADPAPRLVTLRRA